MSAKTWDDYLLNGQLFVTPKQYDALLKAAREQEIARIDRPLAPVIGDIPVVVVRPGEPVDVGDGTMAAFFDGSIYTFPKELGEFNA